MGGGDYKVFFAFFWLKNFELKNFGTPLPPPMGPRWLRSDHRKNFFKEILFLSFCFNNPNYKGVILGCFLRIFEKFWCPTPQGSRWLKSELKKKFFKKNFFFSSGLSHPEPMCGGVGYQNFPKKRKKHLKSPLITGAIEAKKPKKRIFFEKKKIFFFEKIFF